MSDEYKTLNDAPIGEWIDISCEWVGKKDWRKIQVLYKGNDAALVAISDKEEHCVGLKTKWRYPPDPLVELEKRILSEWRTLDTHHDSFSDIPHQWLLEWMIKNGVSYETS